MILHVRFQEQFLRNIGRSRIKLLDKGRKDVAHTLIESDSDPVMVSSDQFPVPDVEDLHDRIATVRRNSQHIPVLAVFAGDLLTLGYLPGVFQKVAAGGSLLKAQL